MATKRPQGIVSDLFLKFLINSAQNTEGVSLRQMIASAALKGQPPDLNEFAQEARPRALSPAGVSDGFFERDLKIMT